jgi:hypothetical protein
MRRVRQGQSDIESGKVQKLTKDEALALIKRGLQERYCATNLRR